MNDNLFNLDELLKQSQSGNPFGSAMSLDNLTAPAAEAADIPTDSEPDSGEQEAAGPEVQLPLGEMPTEPEKPVQAEPAEKEAGKPAPSASELLTGAVAAAQDKQTQSSNQSLFERRPQFVFSGAKEEIDPNKTFDEIRQEKALDFPQLDDSGAVTWSVSYGPVSKSVPDPKKTVVGKLKRDIESSREFLDYLKKGKAPEDLRCVIRPNVRGKSKGRAGYKGIYFTEEEALADSDKVICLIPSRAGQLFEMRKTPVGVCTTPSVGDHDLREVKAGFSPAFPPVPFTLFWQIVSFFRYSLGKRRGDEHEALVLLYWDKQEERYLAVVPDQKAGKAFVEADIPEEFINNDRYVLFADCHSHNTMPAAFSATDDRDERDDHVYLVVGNLHLTFPQVSARVCNGGTFLPLSPSKVIADYPESAEDLLAEPFCHRLKSQDFPEEWKERITIEQKPPAAFNPFSSVPVRKVFVRRRY